MKDTIKELLNSKELFRTLEKALSTLNYLQRNGKIESIIIADKTKEE